MMTENEIRVLILETLRDVLAGTGIVPKGMDDELVDYSELASNLASKLWQAEKAVVMPPPPLSFSEIEAVRKLLEQGGG